MASHGAMLREVIGLAPSLQNGTWVHNANGPVRATFNHPVTFQLSPGNDIRALGFITRESLSRLGLPGHVAVYLPQSYNVAGNLLLVPAERVEAVHAPTSEIVTFLVSGGISGLGVGHSLPPPPPSSMNPEPVTG